MSRREAIAVHTTEERTRPFCRDRCRPVVPASFARMSTIYEHVFEPDTIPDVAPLDVVRAALGPADYDRHDVLLYQGDCIDLLAKLPEALVELTVTSPPYNIGKEYETARVVGDYIDWCERW